MFLVWMRVSANSRKHRDSSRQPHKFRFVDFNRLAVRPGHGYFGGMNRRNLSFVLFLALISGVRAAETAPKSTPPAYKIVRRIQVGGKGGWDIPAIDADAHRLYVSRSNRVIVLDTETGLVIREIPDTPGVHGIAVVPDPARAYITCGKIDLVKVVDLKSGSVLATIPVGKNPDAIFYDRASGLVVVFNHSGQSVSFIDSRANRLIKTVELGGEPEFGVSDGNGIIFVNLEDKSEVVAVDAKNFSVKARWPVAPGASPTGLAFDRKNHMLFAGCANRMVVALDANSGKVVATAPIGQGVDSTAFDESTGLVFNSTREGVLSIAREVSPTRLQPVESLPTRFGSRTLAFDPKSHEVYLPAARFGTTPSPTAQNPRPRPPVLPGSFEILVAGPK